LSKNNITKQQSYISWTIQKPTTEIEEEHKPEEIKGCEIISQWDSQKMGGGVVL